MAGRYDSKHDWRGIAMLTQQLGQLFEPNKAKMMSEQQDHEMNMLMAKQAWDMQSKEVVRLKSEYDALQVNIGAYEDKLYGQDLKALVTASMTDGANPGEASEVFDNTSGKALTELHNTAREYEKMISQREGTLDNFKLYDATAKIGQALRTGSMTKKNRKGEVVDYYKAANQDKIAGLSYEEGQNAIKSYITDNFLVTEGETDANGNPIPSMEMNFGSGKEVETIMVRPEAIAFKAGWDTGTGAGTGRGRAEKGEISDKQAVITQKQATKDAEIKLMGDKTMNQRTDEEVQKMTDFNRNIVEALDKKEGAAAPLSMLVESRNGKIQLKEKAKVFGYTNDEVIQYLSSLNVYNNGVEELGERQIQFQPLSTGQPDTEMLQDFKVYDTHPDSLMSQISISNKADKDDVINSYKEFLFELAPTMGGVERREGIKAFQEWLK